VYRVSCHVAYWHKSEVQIGSEIVRFSAKTGSEQYLVKMTRMTLPDILADNRGLRSSGHTDDRTGP
jgi:hypothetical protein